MHDPISKAYTALLDSVAHHEAAAQRFAEIARAEEDAGEPMKARLLRRYVRDMRVTALRMSAEAAALAARHPRLGRVPDGGVARR
ncbi:hypothetical protein [Methylobacterium sp. JK268]